MDTLNVFTLQSIKSRIETSLNSSHSLPTNLFLLYSPLNQGLKQMFGKTPEQIYEVFTLQSIKSRIETS